ncbi:MAG: hypothetical protein MUE40_05015 [Anaerolineae bacterium]|jgi:hypothetical protein|nr:hypothetical protein [Anaerolineae bacterium]
MPIKFRTYVVIAVVVAVVVFLIGQAFGTGIDQGLRQLNGAARAVGMSAGIADLVTQPLRAMVTGGLPAAVMAGVLWPFAALWLFLMVLQFFFAVFGNGFSQAAGTIR